MVISDINVDFTGYHLKRRALDKKLGCGKINLSLQRTASVFRHMFPKI